VVLYKFRGLIGAIKDEQLQQNPYLNPHLNMGAQDPYEGPEIWLGTQILTSDPILVGPTA
jgi:hypothetical protein